MEGFFDCVDAVVEPMAFAITAATQGVPTKALVPLLEFVPTKGGAPTEGVVIGESALVFSEIPTPQKEAIPIGASQIESTSPATPPPVISISDPFGFS